MFEDLILVEVNELIEMYGGNKTLLEIKSILTGGSNE